VVGRNVNLTARLEAHTVGGQVLISQNTKNGCEGILEIAGEQRLNAKGLPPNLVLYDVQGIAGKYNLFLPKKLEEERVALTHPLRVTYAVVVDKCVQTLRREGHLTCMGRKIAELVTPSPIAAQTNLKMSLFDDSGKLVTEDLFAKVVEQKSTSRNLCLLRFTYVPPEAMAFLETRQVRGPRDT
jgi:adenylate cyclase